MGSLVAGCITQLTETLEIGGQERLVVNLANQLCAESEVQVVCMKGLGAMRSHLDPRVKVVSLDKGEGNSIAAVMRLASTLRHAGTRVLHTHDWGVFLDGAMARAMSGVPRHVHTVHGEYMRYPPGLRSGIKRRLRHGLERWFAARGSTMVCVSEDLADKVSAEVGIPRESIRIVPNGVEPAPKRVDRTSTVGRPFRFISVGRLAEVKNLPMMLQSFARVLQHGYDAHLTFVGDGPERPSLEQAVSRAGLQRHVTFKGFCRDVRGAMDEADAFLLSSKSEGLPMAVLEAMNSGLPVIATRVGGLESAVQDGETGLLVSSGDSDAMARCMERLMHEPELAARFGHAGALRVRERFGSQAMVATYRALYSQHPSSQSARALSHD